MVKCRNKKQKKDLEGLGYNQQPKESKDLEGRAVATLPNEFYIQL